MKKRKEWGYLDDEVIEILCAQRICAWCDKVCSTADHLVAHVIMRHP